MQPAPFTPDRQETTAPPGCELRLSGPVAWVLRWAVRAFIVGQVMLGQFKWPERSLPVPKLSRRMRRAQKACLRQFGRHEARGRLRKAEYYMPRAFTYLSLRALAPADISRAQYKAFYARMSGEGWVRVFGLSSAHEIGAFIAGLSAAFERVGRALTALFTRSLIDDMGPAPP